MEYTYKRIATLGFEDTRRAVEREAGSHGFEVRHVHDLQATLAAKGFPIKPLCIYELWLLDEAASSASEAHLLLPCRLHVYIEEGDVCVAAIRPTLAALMFPEYDFGGMDDRIETQVVKLVDTCSAS